MTNEEAIKMLNKWGVFLPSCTDEALGMAIEALKQVTGKLRNPDDSLLTEDAEACKEQKSKLDLISRQDAIDAMWKALYAYEDLTEKQFMEHEELDLGDWFKHRIFVQRMHEECMKAVNSLPSAEPKHGEWIDWLGKGNEWECSVCKCSIESHGSIAYRYCPMCGADMRGK